MAQLVEGSLPTPEVRGLNPVIGKLLYRTIKYLPTVNCIEKTKIKKKSPEMAQFWKKNGVSDLARKQIIKCTYCHCWE